MGKYIDGTNENFESLVAEGVTMVDFWAPWCGPCRMIAPIVEEIAEEYDGKAKVVKVNTDEQQELAIKFGIRSIPTVLFFKDGQVADQLIGAGPKQMYTQKIDALLG